MYIYIYIYIYLHTVSSVTRARRSGAALGPESKQTNKQTNQ